MGDLPFNLVGRLRCTLDSISWSQQSLAVLKSDPTTDHLLCTVGQLARTSRFSALQIQIRVQQKMDLIMKTRVGEIIKTLFVE